METSKRRRMETGGWQVGTVQEFLKLTPEDTKMREYPPIHPGEILQEKFLRPLGISQYRLAQEIGVPAMRICC